MSAVLPSRAKDSSPLRILAVIACLAAVVVLTFVPPADNDFWLQARIGQIIVETGEIPRTVLFPFTEVQSNRFNAHEWLPSVIFHGFDVVLGHDRLVFALGIFGLLLFGLGARLAFMLTRSPGASALIGLCALLVANFRHGLRPELFALTLMLLLLIVLTSYQQGHRWRVLLWSLPIGVAWANCHGSFLVGPIIASLFAVGEAAQALIAHGGDSPAVRIRRMANAAAPYVLVSVGMVAVSGVNPLGYSLLGFALTLSTSEVTKTYVLEWTATLRKQFVLSVPFAIFAGALMATLAAMVYRRARIRISDVLLVLTFGLLAFQSVRFVVLFGFIAITACARAVGAQPRPRLEHALLVITLVLGVATTALAVRFGNANGSYPFFSESDDFSEPMLKHLNNPTAKGNVFNSYELGAELVYRTWPRLRPVIDSRIDSYGDAYFLAHYNMLRDEASLRRFLDAYDVRYMLLLWRDAHFVEPMAGIRSDGWRLAFGDHKMVLLERVKP